MVVSPPRRPRLLAVVGPTAAGKSVLAVELALRIGGEVVSCDSTAVYRGFDVGTDKPSPAERRGVPHHLIDVAAPTERYDAARYAREAAAAVRRVTAAGRVPVLAGGTGLYYRALTRGLCPAPARDDRLRARLRRVAARRGVERLHAWVARVDPESAVRIGPRDEKRLVRALEVHLLTGRTLTAHFADTRPPLADYDVLPFALRLPAEETARRVARRVDRQFERGVLDEVRRALAAGVPEDAQPFRGLVYRQALEHLQGVRGESATRALIAQENRRYARRQLIWFRKEPNLRWIPRPGEHPDALAGILAALVALPVRPAPSSPRHVDTG